MKKSNIKKFTILGASIVLLSGSILLGGSLAKYITQVEGGGNADIAKWNFNVTSDGETLSTIKLTDSIHQNVRSEKIAPGTNGSFEIELDASSAEVSLDYKIEFLNEQNKPTNLKFSYEGTTTNNLKDLEQLKLILPFSNTSTTKSLINVLSDYKVLIDEKNKNEIDITELRIEEAKRNLGVAYVMEDAVKQDLINKELYKVKLPIELPKSEIKLIYIKNQLTGADKKFIERYVK